MVPDAPGRLSITTVWPSTGRRFSAITRAVRSVLPPATKGTIILMGREGQAWASAGDAACIMSKAAIAVVRIFNMSQTSPKWMRRYGIV